MSKVILIIAGIILLALLVLLIGSKVSAIKSAIGNMNGWITLVLILVLVGAISFIAVKVFLPEGPESILLEVENGNSEGEAPEDLEIKEEEGMTETDFGFSEAIAGNKEGDTKIYITVSRDTVRIGETPFSDMTVFKDRLSELNVEGAEFCLVDDYALAQTYNEVESILQEAEISYKEEERS